MLSIINAVADYLAASGVGTVGTDIFVGQPDAQLTDTVTVVQTGGPLNTSMKALKHVTFVIFVVGEDFLTTSNKTELIHSLLHDKYNVLTGHNGRVLSDHLPGPHNRNNNDSRASFELSFRFVTVF